MHDILVLCQSADSVVDTLCATESEVVELCRKRYAELMASHGSADVKAWKIDLLNEEPTEPEAAYLMLDGTDGETYFANDEVLWAPQESDMLYCRDSDDESFYSLRFQDIPFCILNECAFRTWSVQNGEEINPFDVVLQHQCGGQTIFEHRFPDGHTATYVYKVIYRWYIDGELVAVCDESTNTTIAEDGATVAETFIF